jgi:DNA uptake protein ComE-like DNA-binding protein
VGGRAAAILLAGAALAAGCGVVRFGTPPGAIDLNSADASSFAALPALTVEDARRIVANRPYASKDELLRRKIVDERRYAAIADQVYVGPPGMPEYLRSMPPMPEGP